MFVETILFLYQNKSIVFKSFIKFWLVTLDVNETSIYAQKQTKQR